MLTKAKVSGLVKVEETPVPNHYHDGKIFSSVKVSSQRSGANSKIDYLRLYYDSSLDWKDNFKVGNYIEFTGELVKSKITESLSDIAVSLETMSLLINVDESKIKTGSTLTMQGIVIKINPETVSNNIVSVSILVMSENEEGKKVIAKLTGVGKIAEIIKSIQKDSEVEIIAKVYSYHIKNRLDLSNYYLHDSRISSIKLIAAPVGEVDE